MPTPPKSAQKTPACAPGEDALYNSVTQSAFRPRRSLKHNDTFMVLDAHGDMGAAPGSTDGLFYRDTRFLGRLQLLLNDTQLLLLGSNLRDDNAALAVDPTNPDVFSDHHIVVEKDTVHILRTTFLWRDTAYQRFGVRNYGDRLIEIRLSILFADDFADLFEVRGIRRERRGTATARLRGRDQVLLNYHGLDDKLARYAALPLYAITNFRALLLTDDNLGGDGHILHVGKGSYHYRRDGKLHFSKRLP